MPSEAASLPSHSIQRASAWQTLVPFVDLLFPPQCTACGEACEPTYGGPLFCEPCSVSLEIDCQPRCPRCASRCSEADLPLDNCGTCRSRRTLFAAARTIGTYEGSLSNAVLRAKHAVAAPLARALGQQLAKAIERQPYSELPDVVIPVPRHWLRHAWRNTNPARTIAAAVARHLRLPLNVHSLVCRRLLRQQATLSAPERLRNVRGAFAVRWRGSIQGKRLLLVDDVMTTGATAREASRVLVAAGAASVYVATVARSSPNW